MEVMGFELYVSPVWLIAAMLVFLIYTYATWPYSLFQQLDIAGPKPSPLVGNMFQMFKGNGMHEVIRNWKNQYGYVYGVYFGREPYLVISDLDMLKDILVGKFNCFPNRRAATICQEPLSSGLGALRNNKWKYVRKLLTPAFSTSKMKLMSVLIRQCTDNMMTHLSNCANDGDGPIDLKEKFSAYSNDCLLSAAFGVEIDSQSEESNQFIVNLKQMLSQLNMNLMLTLRIILPFLRPLFDFFNLKVIPHNLMNYFVMETNQTIEFRKSQDDPRIDLLQLMLNAHKDVKEGELDEEERMKLTNNEILGQSLTFYLAGYETTSTMMSYTAYLLATHPHIQDKLRDEINDVMIRHDHPGYDAQREMSYLDQVCCEALRIFPPITSTDRQCSEDCVISGNIFVPKDVNIHIPIWAIHHDPEIYPDPEKFDPQRFSAVELNKRHSYAWLPFGGGPRVCLGMRLAMLESKYAIVRILQKYKLETCAETEIPPVADKKGMLSPVNGIKLKLVQLNDI